MKKNFILLLTACVLLVLSGCTHLTSSEIAKVRREFGTLLSPRFPMAPIGAGHEEELRRILAAMQKVPAAGYSIVQITFVSPTTAFVNLTRSDDGHSHGLIFDTEKKNDDWLVTESPLQPL